MWEAHELGNEDMLWAGIAFNGGIAGQQCAPCGAVSASAVCLGLLHRCSLADKQKAKQSRLDARQDASELVKDFTEKFGTIVCRDLIGLDFPSLRYTANFKNRTYRKRNVINMFSLSSKSYTKLIRNEALLELQRK
jgi:C_GCAxxG_C_C family probable redox protein